MLVVPDPGDLVRLFVDSVVEAATPTPTPAAPFEPAGHTSMPTIIPDLPDVQEISAKIGGVALWFAFGSFVLASVVFAMLTWRTPVPQRLFHFNATFVSLIGMVGYMAMAMGQGNCLMKIPVHKRMGDGNPDAHYLIFRQVFWARNVLELLSTPIMIFQLGLVSGLDGARLAAAVVAGLFTDSTALFSTLSGETHGQKWIWYSVSCAAYVTVIYIFYLHGRQSASARGAVSARFFDEIGSFVLVVATAYPVIWSLSTGSRTFNVNSEVIGYVTGDILIKILANAWILWGANRHESLTLNFTEGFWTTGPQYSQGRIQLPGESESA